MFNAGQTTQADVEMAKAYHSNGSIEDIDKELLNMLKEGISEDDPRYQKLELRRQQLREEKKECEERAAKDVRKKSNNNCRNIIAVIMALGVTPAGAYTLINFINKKM